MAVFVAATFVYFEGGFDWAFYAILFFAFDISIVGYLFSNRIGALLYNFGHSLIMPSFLVVIYLVLGNNTALGLGCLWFAHVGFDRAMGFGLKFSSGFMHTHLGDMGKNK